MDGKNYIAKLIWLWLDTRLHNFNQATSSFKL